jgi:hypothetical protein
MGPHVIESGNSDDKYFSWLLGLALILSDMQRFDRHTQP